MTEKKYEKYFLKEPWGVSIHEPGPDEPLYIGLGQFSPVENWDESISQVLRPIYKPCVILDKKHQHSCAEFLYFIGGDPMNFKEFGAEAKLSMGEEEEKYLINTTTWVYIPAGVLHCPLEFTVVDKPIMFGHVMFASSWESSVIGDKNFRNSLRAPIPRRDRRGKGRGKKPGCASPAMSSWRTATAWWWTSRSPGRPGPRREDTALDMIEKVPDSRRLTMGADKGYDTHDFVLACREMNVTPHVARRKWSIVDERTTRHEGYSLSQRVRKRVEEIWGWVKTVGGGRKLRYKGVERNQLWTESTAVAYNLVRMAKLAAA